MGIGWFLQTRAGEAGGDEQIVAPWGGGTDAQEDWDSGVLLPSPAPPCHGERNGKADSGMEGLLRGKGLALWGSRGRWEAGREAARGRQWDQGKSADGDRKRQWPPWQEAAKGRLSGRKGKQSPGKGPGGQGPGGGGGRGSQEKAPGRQAPKSKEDGTMSSGLMGRDVSGDEQPTRGQRVRGAEEGAGNRVIGGRGGGAEPGRGEGPCHGQGDQG